jgi:hypothetical protein
VMTDDDVRDMLRTKATEARVSPDAWQKIAARIEEAERPKTWWRDARVAIAAAVAAAAGIGGVLLGTQPSPVPVATQPPTSAARLAPDAPHVWVSEPAVTIEQAAVAYVHDRTGARPVGAELTTTSDDGGTVLFRSGPVVTEIFLTRIEDRWAVDSATSDLVPIFGTAYDGRTLTGTAVIEADGELKLEYAGADGRVVMSSGPTSVGFRDMVPFSPDLPGERWVTVRAVLRTTGDGPIALSETWVEEDARPSTPDDWYTGVWPHTPHQLETLQEQADAGERPDLFDPVQVATLFFAERGMVGREARVSILWDEFQQGDNTSGELPYEIEETGSTGTVLLRRLGGDEAIWYVTAVTNDALELIDLRREGSSLVVDVKVGGGVRLTGAAVTPDGEVDATPLDGIEAGQTVSIGFADTDGRAVVTLRLENPDGSPLAVSSFLVP